MFILDKDLKIPSTWQAIPAGKQFALNELQPGTAEYKKVAAEFAKTVGHPQIYKVCFACFTKLHVTIQDTYIFILFAIRDLDLLIERRSRIS